MHVTLDLMLYILNIYTPQASNFYAGISEAIKDDTANPCQYCARFEYLFQAKSRLWRIMAKQAHGFTTITMSFILGPLPVHGWQG